MYAGSVTFLLAVFLAAHLHTGDAVCLSDWFGYNQYCYSFGHENVTWIDGVALCRAYGANLLEIRTRDESDWVINEIKSRQMGGIWLGSSDIFREGEWTWITDSVTVGAVADWADGEPDTTGAENCLEIRREYGYKWNDMNCQGHNNVVCKKP
jgi:hypothetical protein